LKRDGCASKRTQSDLRSERPSSGASVAFLLQRGRTPNLPFGITWRVRPKGPEIRHLRSINQA
jgi:hypothetical protein